MSFAAIAFLVAGGVTIVLVPAMWALYRREQRSGDEARALLGESYEKIERLEEENRRLRSPIETPSERQQSARDELAARGVRAEAPDDAA